MGTLLVLAVLVGMGIAAGIFARKASRDRYSQARDAWKGLAAASAICFGLAAALGVSRCIIVIPPGSVGVAVLFGKVQAKPLSDGLHYMPPWYSVEVMNARTRSYTMSHDVADPGFARGRDPLTSDGWSTDTCREVRPTVSSTNTASSASIPKSSRCQFPQSKQMPSIRWSWPGSVDANQGRDDSRDSGSSPGPRGGGEDSLSEGIPRPNEAAYPGLSLTSERTTKSAI